MALAQPGSADQMSHAPSNDAPVSKADEIVRLRAEVDRLRSENARLKRDLDDYARLLWAASETPNSHEVENFKERRAVWAHAAERADELGRQFREPGGTLPRFDAVIMMLEHAVTTALEMNLHYNPDLSEAAKEPLRQAHQDQLRFLEALNALPEVRKLQILEAMTEASLGNPLHQTEAAVLACYDELIGVRYDSEAQPAKVGLIAPLCEPQFNSISMDEAQRIIADRLRGRTPKAIENVVTRGRKALREARLAQVSAKRSRADAKAFAFYLAYHQARAQLRLDSGDAVSRIRRLLASFS
jgi:hypothetical protein